MRKTFPWIVVILFWTAALPAATITVTSPAAHVTWAVGQVGSITWTAAGSMDSHVKIVLRSGNSVVQVIEDSTENDGQYSWTIPASVTAGPDYAYYVRVKTLDNAVHGDSGAFAIMPALPPPPPPPPPSLTLLSPNGGEEWSRLSQQVIRWKAVNVPGKVKLELVKDNGPSFGFIAVNLDPYAGSFPWAAGKYGFNQTAPAGDYRVIVRAQDSITLADGSDQPFKIKQLIPAEMPRAPINLPKPDLVTCVESGVYLPLRTMGYFHVHVRNAGPGVARAPFVVDTFSNGALISHRVFETDLQPGQSRWVVTSGWSSYNEATRAYSATADPGNQVAETNEDNNTSSGLYIIEAGNPTQNTVIRCGDNTTVEGN